MANNRKGHSGKLSFPLQLNNKPDEAIQPTAPTINRTLLYTYNRFKPSNKNVFKSLAAAGVMGLGLFRYQGNTDLMCTLIENGANKGAYGRVFKAQHGHEEVRGKTIKYSS